MRIPDPKANTTTEAYLAYKAGFLEAGELKPSLYEPNLHFDAWLAYWAGLTGDYPVKNVGKNLFNKSAGHIIGGYFEPNGKIIGTLTGRNQIIWLPCKPNTNYVLKSQNGVAGINVRTASYTETRPEVGVDVGGVLGNGVADKSFKTPPNAYYIVIRYQSPVGTIIQDYLQGILDTIQVEESSSSTASAYEPYSADPEMLCDEEALVAYLSGVTDTYPEEIKDPYDVRIVGYLKHLVSIRWPEPDYPVNNSEFYLSTMKPAVIPSGDPSSDIEIDGTAKGPFIDLKMYGDTYQQTYSGKNLFNFCQFYNNRASFGTNVGSITVTEDSLQYFGNTSTNSQFYYAQDAVNKDIYGMSNLQPSTEYTVSYKATANTQCWIFFFDASNNRTLVQQVFATTDVSMSFTTPANMTWYSVRIDNRAVGNNTISELQIEAGSTPTDYEPYVGGVPAPNPDYPQDVQTVTGEQTVTISDGVDSEDFTISLGSIELCKIGNYQDYIYKSGDGWYLHKAIGKILLTGDDISRVSQGCIQSAKTIIPGETSIAPLEPFDLPLGGTDFFTDNFTPSSVSLGTPSTTIGVYAGNNYANFRIGPDVTSLQDGKNWFNSHNTLFYAKLKTFTDTQITDTTLISQLDALMEGGSYEGETYIKVTATDPNLPGLLYVEAGKYD